MISGETLGELLQQWNSLTEQETQAIQNELWDTLAGLQDSKIQLRTRIDGLLAGTQRIDPQYQGLIRELIELEGKNWELLERRRQSAAQSHLENRSIRNNLKRLRHSYSGQRASAWQSIC